jgi:hypothetical protein
LKLEKLSEQYFEKSVPTSQKTIAAINTNQSMMFSEVEYAKHVETFRKEEG